MLIKINNKPVPVQEETEHDSINWLPIAVNVTGYTILLYVLDYIAYIFFYIHPFPFVKWVGVVLAWIF